MQVSRGPANNSVIRLAGPISGLWRMNDPEIVPYKKRG